MSGKEGGALFAEKFFETDLEVVFWQHPTPALPPTPAPLMHDSACYYDLHPAAKA